MLIGWFSHPIRRKRHCETPPYCLAQSNDLYRKSVRYRDEILCSVVAFKIIKMYRGSGLKIPLCNWNNGPVKSDYLRTYDKVLQIRKSLQYEMMQELKFFKRISNRFLIGWPIKCQVSIKNGPEFFCASIDGTWWLITIAHFIIEAGVITIIIKIFTYATALSDTTTTWFRTIAPWRPICPTLRRPIITHILITDLHITFRSIAKCCSTRATSSFTDTDTIETWTITIWPLTPFLPLARTRLKYWMIIKKIFVKR